MIRLTSMLRQFSVKINAGLASELSPGSMKSVSHNENPHAIAVYNMSGKFYATGGQCSHYKAPMSWGAVIGDCAYCPFHLAPFEISSGKAVSGPALQDIPSYECSVEDGNIMITLPDNVQNAAEFLPPSQGPPLNTPGISKVVIVGGGASGFTCATTLRKLGYTGRIQMYTNEDVTPYDRVALSKNIVSDVSGTLLMPESFYDRLEIEIQKNSEVQSVDHVQKQVCLSNGLSESFDKLLVATGSTARVPPHLTEFLSCSNVATIRSMKDHSKAKPALEQASNVVIIGGSFLGLEAATSIRNKYPEKKVTVIEMDKYPLGRVMGETIGRYIKKTYEDKDIRFLGGKSVKTVNKNGNSVESVNIEDETIPADMLIIATGASIVTQYMPKDLLNEDGSIRVSSLMQTDHSDIFAAGDIVKFPSIFTGESHRIEHWVVAQDHGTHAAYNMLGLNKPYVSVPFFWTNQFVNMQYVGYPAPDSSLTESKDLGGADEGHITYMYKGNRCLGVAVINWPGAAMVMKKALEVGAIPSKSLVKGEVKLLNQVRAKLNL